MNNRTYQPHPIGLFAAQMFGNQNGIKPVLKLKAKSNNTPKTRLEIVTFTEIVENDKPVLAILPKINKAAYGATMDNYRLYVSKYNEMIEEINEEVKRYNGSVNKNISENKMNEVQVTFSQIFLSRHKNKEPKEYNTLVEEFNTDRGLVIEKKKFQTIKYASEIVFSQMFYIYMLEINRTTDEYMKLGVNELSPVRQIEINAHNITNLKRNGAYSINLSNKTVRAHRKRFEEAGILVDYMYRGHKKGVKMNISSQILVVFDLKTQLLTTPENQIFNSQTSTKDTDNNEDTRTINTNINDRKNGQADFFILGTPTADPLSVFYRNIPAQVTSSQTQGARENVKVLETLSKNLEKNIRHDHDLAVNLSKGLYNNHRKVSRDKLMKEAMYGTLSREDFKTIIIHEFFKNAAKLYRNKEFNPFAGSWKTAINNYQEKLFVVNNGNIYLHNKELMVEKLDGLLWRLNHAYKYFSKGTFMPSPANYFDFTRTTKQELGFEYTKKSYDNHVKYMDSRPLKKKEQVKKAENRKKAINYSKKFETELNRFFKNKISYITLSDYVKTNLPANFIQELPERLAKEAIKYDC